MNDTMPKDHRVVRLSDIYPPTGNQPGDLASLPNAVADALVKAGKATEEPEITASVQAADAERTGPAKADAETSEPAPTAAPKG